MKTFYKILIDLVIWTTICYWSLMGFVYLFGKSNWIAPFSIVAFFLGVVGIECISKFFYRLFKLNGG